MVSHEVVFKLLAEAVVTSRLRKAKESDFQAFLYQLCVFGQRLQFPAIGGLPTGLRTT